VKWKLLLVYFSIILFLFLPSPQLAYADSPTHRLDTKGSDGRYFKFDNNCGLWFDAEYIYFGDSNGLWSWIDSNGIRFHSLRMGASECPTDWFIKVDADIGSANVTITRLFENHQFRLSISGNSGANSTTQIYCGSKGEPTSVSGATSWNYESATKICTIIVTHASSQEVTIDWKPGRPPKRSYHDLFVYVMWDNGTVRPHIGVALSRQDFYSYAVTDSNGAVVFRNLVSGTYDITSQSYTKHVNVPGHDSVVLTFTSKPSGKPPKFRINPVGLLMAFGVVAGVYVAKKK